MIKKPATPVNTVPNVRASFATPKPIIHSNVPGHGGGTAGTPGLNPFEQKVKNFAASNPNSLVGVDGRLNPNSPNYAAATANNGQGTKSAPLPDAIPRAQRGMPTVPASVTNIKTGRSVKRGRRKPV